MGSYWHAISHRREGDFLNSRYWLNRCGSASLLAEVSDLVVNDPAVKSTITTFSRGPTNHQAEPLLASLHAGRWNAGLLVDLAREVHANPDDPRHPLAVALQLAEWRALFAVCARSATATP